MLTRFIHTRSLHAGLDQGRNLLRSLLPAAARTDIQVTSSCNCLLTGKLTEPNRASLFSTLHGDSAPACALSCASATRVHADKKTKHIIIRSRVTPQNGRSFCDGFPFPSRFSFQQPPFLQQQQQKSDSCVSLHERTGLLHLSVVGPTPSSDPSCHSSGRCPFGSTGATGPIPDGSRHATPRRPSGSSASRAPRCSVGVIPSTCTRNTASNGRPPLKSASVARRSRSRGRRASQIGGGS
mmetsp:Transcript_27461/g.53897  ORF Transcript_27461/g.53897 Transcript_27461/m.53897 type:complete len:239 (+) Transcript_27461:224-940(+)